MADCPWSQARKPRAGLAGLGDEPVIADFAGLVGLGIASIGGASPIIPGYSTIPARTTTVGKVVWAVRRVRLPLLAPALRPSIRVPRFSRLVLADSVRFVRFNMARPSLPPQTGGLETPERRFAEGRGRPDSRRSGEIDRRAWPPGFADKWIRSGWFPIPRVRFHRPGDAPGRVIDTDNTLGPDRMKVGSKCSPV
jgi:hypothetical protein